MVTSPQALRWDPPGQGPWEAESAHFPRPIPYFGREAFRRAFKAGFSAGSARYGLLLSHFETAFVNGFWYQQPAPFGAPPGAAGPPPRPVLWLLTRVHPGLRARIRQCATAFERRLWREDLRRWDEVDRPAAMLRHRELLAVDPAALDDPGLAAHLRDCERHAEDMVELHHRYTVPCILPVGDLIAHVTRWTDETPGSVLALLRGTTPVSKGILAAELDALAAVLRADPAARAALGGADPQAVIAALEAATGPVGATARAFFRGVRHRALSYEISAKSAGELPELLVGAVRAAVDGPPPTVRDDAAARLAAMRGKVPPPHRATFDALLEEAREINRLRDERGVYTDGFAVGIARRAVLELGRRLVARGRLHDAEDAVDLEIEEACALLAGQLGPSADEVRARVEWRRTTSVADIPPFLGGKPAPPPDPAILPRAARRAAQAVDAVLANLFKEAPETETAPDAVRGLSVNHGVYEGPARIIADASEFGRLQQGDVLVTRATAPYFNVVLPLLGAIVTDRGGQLCHAAIVAREYGIPGIVGTRDATTRIPDGARVRVNGTTGEVQVLAPPAAAAREERPA